MTFVLDIHPTKAMERRDKTKTSNYYDRLDVEFYSRVRTGFIALANQNPEKFCIINGSLKIDKIAKLAIKEINSLLKM
jgi:dTMP kinase